MSNGLNVDIHSLVAFRDKIQGFDVNELLEAATKRVAAGALANIMEITPVGVYNGDVDFTTKDGKHVHFTVQTGKQGGMLRRGWVGNMEVSDGDFTAVVNSYINGQGVSHNGNTYIFNIINPVYYAPYVEEGHRLPNGGFVDGRHMLRDGIANTQQDITAVETMINNKLRELFDT